MQLACFCLAAASSSLFPRMFDRLWCGEYQSTSIESIQNVLEYKVKQRNATNN